MRTHLILILLILLVGGHSSAAPADFALRDGDTVVFLGDSITAARGYGKVIENYTLLRYPQRKVRFINAGHGGDTAEGGLKRLERDVFSRGATLLTVAYGINDIGWGLKADAEHKQRYLDAIRGIVEQCRQHGVRVFICSPAITTEDPNRSENGFLQKMSDEGRPVGTVTERQLHDGMNISSMTADPWEPGGPWDAQASVVKELTEARDRLTMGNLLRNQFLPDHPQRNALGAQFTGSDDRLVALQRDTARPFPYHFQIRPASAEPKP